MGVGRQWFRFIVVGVAVVILWIFVRNAKIDEVDKYQAGSMMPRPRDEPQRVKIAVYYEALCPDSRSFVIRQLEPTYHTIPDNLQVKLIPYGKATTKKEPDGSYRFECQHGPRECTANIIHACSIHLIEDLSLQLRFVSCMIGHNLWPENITRTCGEWLQVDAEPILECSKSPKGEKLLAMYGDLTRQLYPPASFIPTITIDNDASNQVEILKNLLTEVCKRFKVVPAGCS